ncbi:hypothetical protein OBBRIDRAFT_787358 [Obba rivulosa]|uniref:Uncharacterized protein n=1 Tax=Obba rivulosa TaxID=1052685 RepID=A0A8E2DV86_9APHY|nr:hypothetical protein OBBRIDRAFT_787358 [Obba rivulosa]
MTSLHPHVPSRSRCLVLLSLALSASAQNDWGGSSGPAHVAAGIVITVVLFFILLLVFRMFYLRRSQRLRTASAAAPAALAYNASNSSGLPSYWAGRAGSGLDMPDHYPPPPGTPPPPPPYPGKAAMDEQPSATGDAPVPAANNPFLYQHPRAAGTQQSLPGTNPWAENTARLAMPALYVEPPPAAYIQNANTAPDRQNPWADRPPPAFSADGAAPGTGAPNPTNATSQGGRFGWFGAR